MPRKPHELVWIDIQAIWQDVQPELARRGMYPELTVNLVVSQRKPSVAHDLSLELTIRRRHNGVIVWRSAESFKIPGRMKLRPVGNVVASLLQRAIHDLSESYPLPGDDNAA